MIRCFGRGFLIFTAAVFLNLLNFQSFAAPTEIPASTEDLVSFSARLEPSTIRNGEKFRLEIDVDLKPDWHIYSVIPLKEEDAPRPTAVELQPGLFVPDGPLYETRPTSEYIDVLKYSVFYHDHHAELYWNLELQNPLKPGEYNTSIRIGYQLCTDVICLPLETREQKISFTVGEGQARKEYLAANRTIDQLPSKKDANVLSGLLSGGFWAFLGFAALMGLVSLLTPCVFPMIPITVSFFSKQAEGSHSKVIKLALLFVAGIVITYTGFGLLVSAVFGAGSALSLAANPVVNLVIALVFILFALSLMGLFNISLPTGIQIYFDQKARHTGGAIGVILMGVTFTLTAFTCTVQFVGTMLIAAAQGEWMWPILGMLVFSGVFAFPFFLLAIVPSFVRKMQGKSGEWLGRSKFVLGVLELMASVKFLSNADLVWQTNLISRNLAIFIWIILTVIIVLYLLWTGLRPKLNRSPWQWVSVLLFCFVIILLVRGWNDRSLGSLIDAVLPPPSMTHQSSQDYVSPEEAASLVWLDSFEEAKKQAIAEGKPIFLEFTGYTCVNCRWMEQNILLLTDIHHVLSEKFITVRLYTDGGENAKRNLKFQIDHFETVALPFYVRLNKDGSPHSTFSGISLDPQEFLDFLSD